MSLLACLVGRLVRTNAPNSAMPTRVRYLTSSVWDEVQWRLNVDYLILSDKHPDKPNAQGGGAGSTGVCERFIFSTRAIDVVAKQK